MAVALRQPTLASAPSPSFCDGRKFAEVEQALLWTVLQQDLHCTSRDLLAKAAQHQIWPRVTLRQINRWRAKWQLSRGKRRPPRTAAYGSMSSGNDEVCFNPRLYFVWFHLFFCWIVQIVDFESVVAELKKSN